MGPRAEASYRHLALNHSVVLEDDSERSQGIGILNIQRWVRYVRDCELNKTVPDNKATWGPNRKEWD